MKKILLTVLLSAFFLSANASHQVAGDIGYTCLGNNQFEFYIYFYRDCGGISAPTSMTLGGTSSCGNVTITLNAVDLSPNNPNSLGIVDTIGLCPSMATTCTGGTSPGFEIYKLVGTATINPCSDWVFCATTCCRNASGYFPPQSPISTYSGSSMAYACTINNANGACDDSPIWKQSPVKFVCQGIQTTMNNGAVDPDGDSLVFELIDAYEGCSGGVVTYITPTYNSGVPFSATYPMSTVSGTFPFNQSTGMSSFTPKVLNPPLNGVPMNGYNEVAVIAVKISSYRNGILKGTIMRDMQVTTMQNCDPLNTTSQGVSQVGNQTTVNGDTISVLAGNLLDFKVLIMDPINIGNPFTLWNTLEILIPSTQFSYDTVSLITIVEGHTTLQTNTSHIGIYNFDIVARNSGCPIMIEHVYPYILQVLPNPNASINSDLSNKFKIYPNPTTNLLSIKLPEGLDKANVSILDITGKTYNTEQIKSNVSNLKLDLPRGIYFVKIETDTEFVVKKLLVE